MKNMENRENMPYAEYPAGDIWQDGMVSGNGTVGVICAGDPSEELMIFQNIHFIMPTGDPRCTPDEVGAQLEEARQSVLDMDDSWDVHGRKRTHNYAYHPGFRLRVKTGVTEYRDYRRYTDYNTAEIVETFETQEGSWNSRTFVSREDNVILSHWESNGKGKINAVVSIDDLSDLPRFGQKKRGEGPEKKMQYKKLAEKDGSMLGIAVQYPFFENSELRDGGYAGVTKILIRGGSRIKASVKKKAEAIYVSGEEEPVVEIKNAEEVWMITALDRTFYMGAFADFAATRQYALVDTLKEIVNSVCHKYQNAEGDFSYEDALKAHKIKHQPLIDQVAFSLGANEDSGLSNEKLLQKQRNSKELLPAMVERAYRQGRYAQACCAKESFSRLCGMWTGEWNPGWSGAYTMDANVNIQAAGMNVGNMKEAGIGYINFVLQQIPDWQENAEKVYGMKDAILVPVNTDGDCAKMFEYDIDYPFQYWNAGASWMLLPIFEFWQCFGNSQIPVYDEHGTEIKKLDLEKEVLMPLLALQANFWMQLCTPEYYVDRTGKAVYEKGKQQLNEGEHYLLIPSYSPENHPADYGSTLTANATMDISAARDGLCMAVIMAQAVQKRCADAGYSEKISAWEQLMKKLPEYQYDASGALKEWALQGYRENNRHRHISHLYCAWPAQEAQKDDHLKNACITAIENRNRENKGIDDTASHGWVHKALVEARLGNAESVEQILYLLMQSDIYYSSFMTDHNTDRSKGVYCTDTGIGVTGIVQEMLLYSDTGEIQILPALPRTWKRGCISGLLARTLAKIDRLAWDQERGEVELTILSGEEQQIAVSCGVPGYALADGSPEAVVHFGKNEKKTLRWCKI